MHQNISKTKPTVSFYSSWNFKISSIANPKDLNQQITFLQNGFFCIKKSTLRTKLKDLN